MLENLFCAAVAILAVWGCMGLVYMLLMSLIRPKKNEQNVLVLLPEGSAQAAVERVSYLISKLSVTGELRYTVIAVICEKTDTARRQALSAAFGGEPRVTVCDKAGFIARFLE